MYKFEKLKVWQESLVLIKMVYKFCQQLPTNEKNNAIDQLRRAVLSISLNISEGTGAASDKEQLRFLFISRKSLYEVVCIIKILEQLYIIDANELYDQINLVGKLLSGFIKNLKSEVQCLKSKV